MLKNVILNYLRTRLKLYFRSKCAIKKIDFSIFLVFGAKIVKSNIIVGLFMKIVSKIGRLSHDVTGRGMDGDDDALARARAPALSKWENK